MNDEARAAAYEQAQDFMEMLQHKYGISSSFLLRCHQAIVDIYTEFDGARRQQLLDTAEATVARQAKAEAIARESHQTLCEMQQRLCNWAAATGEPARRYPKLEPRRHEVMLAVGPRKRPLH